VADLARGLNNAAVPGAVRAKLRRLETAQNAAPLAAPVPPAQAARVQRGAAYAVASEHVTRWQPLVKANREARTLVFPASNAGAPKPASTTAALAAAFTVDTELEQQVAALLSAGGAATSAGVRATEAAELQASGGSSSEAKERTARLAKMRALLFYHESKAKRLKNIKSKGYHRHAMQLAKRALRKLGDTDAGTGGEGDGSAAAALEAAEMARMTERFGLKHRNTSRWARRLLAKGLGKLPATRQALAEQMRLGEELRAKPLGKRGTRDSDGDDGTDASDDDDGGDLDDGDDDDDGEGEDNPEAAAKKRAAKLATKARQEAMDVLLDARTGGGDAAQGGLLSLPFMQRAQAKARTQAAQAAADLLAELDGEAGGGGAAGDGDADEWDVPMPHGQGRMVFGGAGTAAGLDGGGDDEPALERGSDESDGEYEQRNAQAATAARMRRRAAAAAGPAKPALGTPLVPQATTATTGTRGKVSQLARSAAASPGAGLGAGLAAARSAATQLELAMGEEEAPEPARRQRKAVAGSGAAAGGVVKPPNSKERRQAARRAGQGAPPGDAPQPAAPARKQHEAGAAARSGVPLAPGSGRHAVDAVDDGDGDAPEEMVGGVSARQRAVIAAAFAGDDVAAEFASAKAAEVAAEAPDDGTEILATAVLPGWGAWAEEQSVPRAAKAAAAVAKARAAAAVASRKDAGKAHVIVSEKFDRKAATYTVPSLPYPYTSREVFDSTLRQPLSREVNTDASFRDLTRPAVITTPGALIAPIKFKRVQPAAQKGSKQQKGGKQGKQAAPRK
jgi:U3 small nucleolar RNA-associated protein 14